MAPATINNAVIMNTTMIPRAGHRGRRGSGREKGEKERNRERKRGTEREREKRESSQKCYNSVTELKIIVYSPSLEPLTTWQTSKIWVIGAYCLYKKVAAQSEELISA